MVLYEIMINEEIYEFKTAVLESGDEFKEYFYSFKKRKVDTDTQDGHRKSGSTK